MENAVLHGFREDGRPLRVELTAPSSGDGWRIEIADDGTGIAPEAPAEGNGIGLANVRERVERLKGRLTVDSAPGRGTRVCLEMPA